LDEKQLKKNVKNTLKCAYNFCIFTLRVTTCFYREYSYQFISPLNDRTNSPDEIASKS